MKEGLIFRMEESSKRLRSGAVPIWLFLLVYCCFITVHQRRFDTGTPVSRLDALRAITLQGTLSIDRWRTNTPDVAFANGHYYSDKAPATLVLALPGYAMTTAAATMLAIDADDPRYWLIGSWGACAGISILTCSGMFAMRKLLVNFVTPPVAWLTVCAIWFGAAPLPYSTLLFSHAHVVSCLAIAMNLLFGTSAAGATSVATSPRNLIWAGFWLGLALSSEFTSGLVVLAICVAALRTDVLSYFRVALGALPPLSLIPLYSWLTIGNPFELPYSYQASFPEMSQGIYGIRLPDLQTALELTFLPTRGFFFWSPFLLVSVIGFPILRRERPSLFWVTYLVSVSQIAILSGRVWDWQAGFTLGPRYLAPLLPLLAIPCALGWKRFPRAAALLAAYSILITVLATATDICVEYHIVNPLLELHIPSLVAGMYSFNLFGFLPISSGAAFIGFLALVLAAITAGVWFTPTNPAILLCAGETATERDAKIHGGSVDASK